MYRSISPGLSLYLDLVRFLAAVSVLLYHTWTILFPQLPFKWPGHEAVVIFFVLSGYVITHATSRPGVTLGLYLQHRAARILPVAICALLLAALITPLITPLIGTSSSFSEATPGPVDTLPFWRATLANLLFIAQSGSLFISPPFNTPFWSLNYEVWYYLIFAAWLYSPARWRLPLTGLAALLAGPKILLLLPVWLYGVWLYRHLPKLSAPVAWIVFSLTLMLAAALTWFNISDILRTWLYGVFPSAWHAHFSTQFIYDLILGLVVSANFAAVAAIGNNFRLLFLLQKPIRYLAGVTFSTYVFHMPLALLAWNGLGIRGAAGFYAFMAIAIFLLAELTERRTGFYRRLLSRRPVQIPAASQ